jgi:HD-like signal output (HDOD) protein/prolyl-tRNA editing enzyme YbaK/EbsC (Cys-tRNA(Pro) deacylase)
MALPTSVQHVLSKWKVEYSMAETPGPTNIMNASGSPINAANTARVVFLKDNLGKVQVVLPGNRLLDLNQLAHQFGRQFTALGPDELQRMKQQLGLDDFPALPQLTCMESLIDRSLLDQDELYIVSGQNRTWLRLPSEQFRALASSSQIGHFSSPLQQDVLNQNSSSDLDDIHLAIKQFTPLRIQQRLQDTLDLPPLPETARRIIDLRLHPDADAIHLAQVVELDPSMSAQIISWARSPYYRSRSEIRSVEDAVSRVLGFDLVMNLALGLSLGKLLSIPRDGPAGYAPFWQQAVLIAALSQDLARRSKLKKRPDTGLAYLCGLLHNFGHLILGQVFPPQFSLINRHIEANPHINRLYIERHLLGLTREQIAACLLQQWHMPTEVVVAIRHQHNPAYNEQFAQYARILYIAVRALRAEGYGDGPQEEPEASVLEDLGLTTAVVKESCEELLSHMNELSELIEAMGG